MAKKDLKEVLEDAKDGRIKKKNIEKLEKAIENIDVKAEQVVVKEEKVVEETIEELALRLGKTVRAAQRWKVKMARRNKK